MTRLERAHVADILALQDHAYRLLLWLGDRARSEPELLSREAEETFVDRHCCLAWLEAHRDTLPVTHRCPGREQELASLLSSLLRTSFHVKRFEWEGRTVQAELRTGPGHVGASAAKRARHGGSLEYEALRALCRDEELRIPPRLLSRVVRTSALRADLHVWCYAFGLVRRAEGRGEGLRDWEHWRAIPADERKSLNADSVWAARARLLRHLETLGGG